MKKTAAALLAAALCTALLTGPALAAEPAQTPYFISQDLEVLPQCPESLTFTYLRAREDQPDVFETDTAVLTVDSCTAAPAGTAGFTDVTLVVSTSLDLRYNQEQNVRYDRLVWLNGVHDYYTGLPFRRRDLDGSASDRAGQTIDYGGVLFPITFTTENVWDRGEVTQETDGWQRETVTCTQTWQFTVPNGYNGLVFVLRSVDALPGEEEPEDERPSGQGEQFFRFGRTADGAAPRLYVDSRTENGYHYGLLNPTDRPLEGSWLLLTRTAEGGEAFPLDARLKADGARSGELVTDSRNLSRREPLLLSFGSSSARDRFLYRSGFQNRDGRWLLTEPLASDALTGNGVTAVPLDPAEVFASGLREEERVAPWAAAEVDAAFAAGLVTEHTGSFMTDDTTRLQFAELAVNLLEKLSGQPVTPAPEGTFADCDDPAVRKAFAAGIVGGTAPGIFSPDQTTTREQIAAMLCRTIDAAAALTGTDLAPEAGDLSGFSDGEQAARYARESLGRLVASGVMGGTGPSTLSPKKSCTVQESVLLVYRLYQKSL